MEGFPRANQAARTESEPAFRRLTPSSLQIGYHFAKQHRQIAGFGIAAGCGVFPA